MRAIILAAPGSTDNISMPSIVEHQVLVKAHSIGINPIDIKTRKGAGVFRYADLSEEPEVVLAWDMSGVVTESKSSMFHAGDEVFGTINFPDMGKTYAEYVAAPAAHLAIKSSNISFPEAAAGCLALLTAYQVLCHQAHIKKGDRVLIHAASGGVGHYAVQIAKHLSAYVVATSSAANKDFMLSLGADEHIDYHYKNAQ